MRPISFPAVVQPHGAAVMVDLRNRLITHASENTDTVLGVEPAPLLGQSVDELRGAPPFGTLATILDAQAYDSNPISTTVSGRRFDMIVRPIGESLLVEFEPFFETPRAMRLATRRAMRRFAAASSVADLWQLAATEFRTITGFDRVMVEHFHEDGHGEIVAESVAPGLKPALGLLIPAFPESMVTAASKLSRTIVDSSSLPVAVLADPRYARAGWVDPNMTELGAVSPLHLAFMADYDMTSSFTLSLVYDGTLIGLIMGGHRAERRLPYDLRDEFEVLANQVAVQLSAMRDIEQLARRNDHLVLRAALTDQAERSGDLVDALLHRHVTLLDLIPADGVAIRFEGRVDVLGRTPDPSKLERLTEWLAADRLPANFVTDNLAATPPTLASALGGVAGVLVQPLNSTGDYLAWFRSERADHPGWRQDFDVGAEPWSGIEREARELLRELQTTLERRAQSQLAQLALQDPLTGLPNRRVLMVRLEQEMVRLQPDRSLAMLFIDLDDFKLINDSFGHAAGDAALRHAASALQRSTRPEDTVARFGGDEFVVLCPGVTASDARATARRILDSIAAPPTYGSEWRLGASVGLAFADGTADVSQVLDAADAALYRAKLAGRSSISE